MASQTTASISPGVSNNNASGDRRIFYQLLPSMRYKTFSFPNNPAECKYIVDRAFAKHKYSELEGTEIEDMDPNAIVLSGSGEFFGPLAYTYWQQLNAVYNTHGIGEVYHPIFTDLQKGLMTKLEATLEPRDDYVSYIFEIHIHNTMPWVQTKPIVSNVVTVDEKSGNTVTNIKPQVGDIVVVNGYAYYTSYGATPRSALLTNKTMTVTYVNYKGTHPICVGSIGWVTLDSVGVQTSSTPSPTSGQTTYVVKAGDTLSGIGVRYNIDWREIASANNIKNPNIIHIGDVLIIPSTN